MQNKHKKKFLFYDGEIIRTWHRQCIGGVMQTNSLKSFHK